MTTAGVLTDFPPIQTKQPYNIVAGPDGNLWFSEWLGNSIGRITTAGVITEFPISTAIDQWILRGIAVGPDGNIWFTEWTDSKIPRPSGHSRTPVGRKNYNGRSWRRARCGETVAIVEAVQDWGRDDAGAQWWSRWRQVAGAVG